MSIGRRNRLRRLLAVALISLIWSLMVSEGYPSELLRSNDVICFLGGANVVSAQEYGYLETILRMKLPALNLRCRSLGHEGDTAFEQPRDYNYPTISKQLDEAGATVVISYFGQMEALVGPNRLKEFIAAYEKLLGPLANRRIVLVSPFQFERAPPPLPDLSPRNNDVSTYAAAIETLAKKHGWIFINSNLGAKKPNRPLTGDGLHLTAGGHWHYDYAVAAQLGPSLKKDDLRIDPKTGALSLSNWEQARQAVLAKNRLWFSYYRPMNWAFLGGDRTDQPSSRDYRDPKIRWFPDEMKRFLPLLEGEEAEIGKLAAAASRQK